MHPRLALPRLLEAMGDSPAVLIHGPRQAGKTTLARQAGAKLGCDELTFDDDTLRRAAAADPVGFVARLPRRVILDEIQRAPSLFTSIKLAIDRDRTPGRFLLTGSSNVLLLPELSDSLAGRMAILRLHPLAQDEIGGHRSRFLDRLLRGEFRGARMGRSRRSLAERVVAGGFPAAIARATEARRAAWYRDYVESIVQRDLRDLARVAALDALPRLMKLVAGQTARLLNVSALAAPFQVSQPTMRSYLHLLARVFLVDELPPWHESRLQRLVKTPKLHVGDTGVAAALLGVQARDLEQDRMLFGQLLESFVVQELRRQASGRDDDLRFHHFRDRDGSEVDLVIEQGTRTLAGVEVKAAASVASSDFNGLRKLAAAVGKRFAAGAVIYDGEHLLSFGNRLFAVPATMLWDKSAAR